MNYNRQQYDSRTRRYRYSVIICMERDDNNRITTSKSDTITRKGQKKHRRLMSDTLFNLPKKFIAENQSMKISYSSFCQLRPFWVVTPTHRDRKTCLCKLLKNGQILIQVLTKLKLLPDVCTWVESCVDHVICDQPSKLCFTRKCVNCVNKWPQLMSLMTISI